MSEPSTPTPRTNLNPRDLPDGTCLIIGPTCTGRAVHRHHRKMRSRGGTDNPVNLVACCLACHNHVHANPRDASERGFLLHSWEDETPLARLW